MVVHIALEQANEIHVMVIERISRIRKQEVAVGNDEDGIPVEKVGERVIHHVLKERAFHAKRVLLIK